MRCTENRSHTAAPQGVYRCADGEWVALSVGSDEEWVALCGTLGRVASAHPTLAARRAEHDLIDGWVAAWCAARPQKEALGALGAMAEPVVNAYDADKDEQMNARGFWEPVEHPLVGELRYPGWPMRLTPGPERWYRTPAPLLGEHNDEVLAALGVTPEVRAALRADRVIGDRLP
jgi:crotonobetainyl-CoA:carnitine CoA-transferase CaiB-like acyl-CoA transferase